MAAMYLTSDSDYLTGFREPLYKCHTMNDTGLKKCLAQSLMAARQLDLLIILIILIIITPLYSAIPHKYLQARSTVHYQR